MAQKNITKQICEAHARHIAEINRNFIGKPISAIQEELQAQHELHTKSLSSARGLKKGERWYPGTVTVTGFIYGSLTAKIRFGDGNDWNFDGSWWGGVGAGSAVGGGPWAQGFINPSQGQKMDFVVVIGAYTAGEIQVYWSIRKKVIGCFVGICAGIGAGGGKGSGTWKKA